eukprot:SAG11_NODE_5117_length_1658_cov_7.623477_2_plen_211_part_00
MRGDGSSFTLKFMPTGGFTYNLSATLRPAPPEGSGAGGEVAAAHLRLAIYPPESISSAGDGETAAGAGQGGGGCELPHEFESTAHDVGELTVGTFVGAGVGRQSWGEQHCAAGIEQCCDDGSRVGPPETPCDGSYRHFAGRAFGPQADWQWACPLTGQYILQVSANCDVSAFRARHRPTDAWCIVSRSLAERVFPASPRAPRFELRARAR